MKKVCLIAILCAFASRAGAQVATPPAQPAGAARGQTPVPAAGGGRGQPAAPSNEVAGVDIDRFIGNPVDHAVHISHGTLLTHSILGAGNPYEPGAQGAVLEYRKELATATLLPNARTPLEPMPDEYFFYVKSGTGRLDDGKLQWDLRDGIAILAPPNVPYRFANTSDKPLEMIMLQWTAGPNAHDQLMVRDVNLIPWCEENAHWNNTSRCVFSAADGLIQGERIYLVMLQPWAVSQPHNHTPGTEEIWTKVTPGTATILLGSELREMPEDSAYLVPPNGLTDHSNLNLSKDRVEWWIYVARGPAPPAGAPPPAGGRGAGGGGRGPVNPNISHDVTEATVAGKPLN
jgi:mannose-6-phosphate isomerase-like protein (cupin superfamily)